MQVSAEIRWFWRAGAPAGLEDWFRTPRKHECPAGGGAMRVDEYLLDGRQAEVGVKRRGGKPGVEVKGLVGSSRRALAEGVFAGPIEIWAKWTLEGLVLEPEATMAISKQRWLRRFDTTGPNPREVALEAGEQPVDEQPLPGRGCNAEFTRVLTPGGDVWWTLGLEAFGSLWTVEDDLRAVAAALAAREPPGLDGGSLASYPTWLDQLSNLELRRTVDPASH